MSTYILNSDSERKLKKTEANLFPFFVYSSAVILSCLAGLIIYSSHKIADASIKIDSLKQELISLHTPIEQNLFYSELYLMSDSNTHGIYLMPTEHKGNKVIESFYFERTGDTTNTICVTSLAMRYYKVTGPVMDHIADTVLINYIGRRMTGNDKRRLCRACFDSHRHLVDSLLGGNFK